VLLGLLLLVLFYCDNMDYETLWLRCIACVYWFCVGMIGGLFCLILFGF